jgi:hypothetical protein
MLLGSNETRAVQQRMMPTFVLGTIQRAKFCIQETEKGRRRNALTAFRSGRPQEKANGMPLRDAAGRPVLSRP